MQDMKYIRTERFGILMFDPVITHSNMVFNLGIGDKDVVSAGFVSRSLQCYGESTSFKKKSLAEDTAILSRQFKSID